MKISFSVIIVAYKSRSFIACCLSSIAKAALGFDVEIIVIDNASNDGLGIFLTEEFPNVRFSKNEQNVGFGSACNQGSRIATGAYLIFLNPDTVVSRDFFNSMCESIVALPEAGILSSILYDGAGHLLPESARRIPTVISAIKKSIGRTQGVSQYYEQITSGKRQEILIAAGAAMLIQKSKFENIEGFDERFFMYAEDIDLSYRVRQSGYKNYLIKSAPVIHLKGESTSKSGWNYNRYFYATMATFVKKYRGSIYSNLDYYVVAIATFILGIFSLGYHSIVRAKVGIFDFLIGLITCFGVQYAWSYLRYGVSDYFGHLDHLGSYLLYVGIWIFGMVVGGGYWKDCSRITALKALSFGIIISIVVYSLVPLDWRFSRMIIVLSGLIMLLIKHFKIGLRDKNIIDTIHYVTDDKQGSKILELQWLKENITYMKNVKSCILNSVDLSPKSHVFLRTDDAYDPIEIVLKYGDKLRYSFVNEKTRQIVSSHFAARPGDKYDHLSHHNLSKQTYLFQKRVVDVFTSFSLLLPLILFQIFQFQKFHITTWMNVLKGKKTLVGYGDTNHSGEHVVLPDYLILCYSEEDSPTIRREKILHYSLHYSIFDDIYYIVLNLKGLLSAYTYGRINK